MSKSLNIFKESDGGFNVPYRAVYNNYKWCARIEIEDTLVYGERDLRWGIVMLIGEYCGTWAKGSINESTS